MASPFEQAREKLNEVNEAQREFFDAVAWAISQAPVLLGPAGAEIVEAAQSALEDLRREIDLYWSRFNQMLAQPGEPERLRAVARIWVEAGNGIGDAGGLVGLDRMQSNIEWQGKAAEAYKAMVPSQASKATALKASCVQMAGSLDALADQLDAFWTALLTALGIFLAGVLGAAAAVATVAGIPAGIATFAGAVVVSGGVITAAVVAVNSLVDRINSEQNSIKQASHDAGAWPAPNTSALSDASVNDGSSSDWRPRG